MSQYTVLFDANVLYPAPMRDALMQLAVTDLFKAKWTADIHREWIDALLRNEPHRDRAALERTRDLMDRATRDCLITGYEALVPALTLPDPDDRHVLAAAIVGRCDAIVTQNLKDFPPETLAPFGIETQHPDDFFRNQLSLAPGLVCSALRKVRARLKNPPKSVDEYLAILTQQGLVSALALGIVVSFAVGAAIAAAFGYTDAVSMATIGGGAATYIVGPVTGTALGASSEVIALSVAAGLLKAVLVMIGTPLVAPLIGLNNPKSAMAYGGLMGTTSGVAGGLAATDKRLVPYGAMTATFFTGLGCLMGPSVLYLALLAVTG